MAIKTKEVSLVCNYGGDELLVFLDDDGEVVFKVIDGDTSNNIYVSPRDAKLFADTINDVIAGRV